MDRQQWIDRGLEAGRATGREQCAELSRELAALEGQDRAENKGAAVFARLAWDAALRLDDLDPSDATELLECAVAFASGFALGLALGMEDAA